MEQKEPLRDRICQHRSHARGVCFPALDRRSQPGGSRPRSLPVRTAAARQISPLVPGCSRWPAAVVLKSRLRCIRFSSCIQQPRFARITGLLVWLPAFWVPGGVRFNAGVRLLDGLLSAKLSADLEVPYARLGHVLYAIEQSLELGLILLPDPQLFGEQAVHGCAAFAGASFRTG